MLPPTIERRYSNAEIRLDPDGATFAGRAVVYDRPSDLIYGSFYETIQPGAFDESLRSGKIDVYCSIDHDANRILGKVSAGTLTLSPDDAGIGVECPVAEYSYAKDLQVAIQRGDISGMSFIFDVLDDEWSMKDGRKFRTVKKADLYEVSFVYFPAYSETTAGMRSIPLAIPIDGEQRALSRMYHILDKYSLENCRKRLRLSSNR